MKWFQKKENIVEAATPIKVLLKRKIIIAATSLSLLVAVAAIGTVGWYTRMNNISGITLDVAKFDFRANFSDTTFIVDVNDYLNVHQDKAAPGTSGVIPVLLTNSSEVDVKYTVYMDLSPMAPEMLERVRFYVYRAQTNSDGTLKTSGDEVLPVTVDGTDSGEPQKFYLGGIRKTYAAESGNSSYIVQKDSVGTSGMLDLGDATNITASSGSLNYYCVTGTLKGKTQCYEYIYWEWIYELDNSNPDTNYLFYNVKTGRWESWNTWRSSFSKDNTDFTAISEAHDLIDTNISIGEYNKTFSSTIDTSGEFTNVEWDDKVSISGTGSGDDILDDGGLYAYQKVLSPKICADGVQSNPQAKESGNTDYSGDVLTTGGGLTVYINEDKL